MQRMAIRCQAMVRRWRYQLRYKRIQAATLVIQCRVRQSLAQRRLDFLRRDASALRVQTCWRRAVARIHYQRDMQRIILLQCWHRGNSGRAVAHERRRLLASIKVQTWARMQCRRREYQRMWRSIIIFQKWVRRLLAQCELRRLRIEARDLSKVRVMIDFTLSCSTILLNADGACLALPPPFFFPGCP